MKGHAVASAPTKLILFGEHFVVYGAPGIAIPTSLRNTVEVTVAAGEPGLQVRSDMGDVFIRPDGDVGGDASLSMFGAPYLYLLEGGIGAGKRFEAKITRGCRSKGMGNSSSIGAALGLALAGACGEKLSKDDVFECAQKVDEVAHGGGRPSGIDARTVVEGKPQRFVKLFDPVSFEFEAVLVKLPRGFSFVAVDTYKGAKAKTGDQIRTFGLAVKAGGAPGDISRKERERVCAPYLGVYERAVGVLGGGKREDAGALGKLMNEDHELLALRGVSTKDMELARAACLQAGASGAKLSGAGGPGGVVLALVEARTLNRVLGAVKKLGFSGFEVKMADRGAALEK